MGWRIIERALRRKEDPHRSLGSGQTLFEALATFVGTASGDPDPSREDNRLEQARAALKHLISLGHHRR